MWILLVKKPPHYSDFSSYSLWAGLFTIELQMSQKQYNIPLFEKFKSQPRNQIAPLYKAIQLL